jgi:hypothetical protein
MIFLFPTNGIKSITVEDFIELPEPNAGHKFKRQLYDLIDEVN